MPATLAEPSPSASDMIPKNVSKLPPGCSTRQIGIYDNCSDFRCCCLHGRSPANLYTISKLNCSRRCRKPSSHTALWFDRGSRTCEEFFRVIFKTHTEGRKKTVPAKILHSLMNTSVAGMPRIQMYGGPGFDKPPYVQCRHFNSIATFCLTRLTEDIGLSLMIYR